MDINYYKKYEPIDGKWYINKELGNGAFGTVFEIERRDFTNDKSALKIITIPSSPNEVRSYREENYDLDEKSISSYFYGFVEEFTKEFALMTKLKGQNNVVRIEDYDVKEHEDDVGWDIFIRMELLTPMNKHFAQNPPKTRDVIKLGIDICKALEVCQKFNIVHRDIKPSNIFVSDAGEYKLGDFGVARTLEKTSSGLSKKGTYTYMAPEVYKGEAYGSNVDIYSLGIVMYKLLNNNMEPYKQGRTHEDDEKALVARLKGEPMTKPANADGRLAEIILKACAFDPKDRYESPLQMREELENILYSENEEKIIYPEGEVLEFVPTDIPGSEEPDTSGIFDEKPKDNIIEDDGPTRGIFDEVITKHDDVIPNEPQKEENSEQNRELSWKGILAICSVLLVIIIAAIWGATNNSTNNVNDVNQISNLSVGDTITFGTFEQDGDTTNGTEPIEWRVIDEIDGAKLLISEYLLDAREFYDEYLPERRMTWDNSDIRIWLNSEFYETAFTEDEKNRIIVSEIETASVYGGSNDILTYDKVFLLSADEANTYFNSDEERYTTATQYAINNSIFDWNEDHPNYPVLEHMPAWQLRSSGSADEYYAAIVGEYGEVYPEGNCYIGGRHGIRPVIWLCSDSSVIVDTNSTTDTVLSYVDNEWNESNRVSLKGWDVAPKEYNRIIENCKSFTLRFSISDVIDGNPYGMWLVYLRNTNGVWNQVYSFEQPSDEETIWTVSAENSTFEAFDAIALVRASDQSSNHSYWFNTENFNIETN